MSSIPSYEELKSIKDEKIFYLYGCLCGGYFRLKINEDCKHNIALDFLDGGFLNYIHRDFNSDYKFSHLYKFNKKNYNGLIKLYKTMLNTLLKDIQRELKELNG